MDLTFTAFFVVGLAGAGIGAGFCTFVRNEFNASIRRTNRLLFRDLTVTRADRDFYKSAHDVLLCKLDELRPLADLGERRRAAIEADKRRRKDLRRDKLAA